MSYTPKTWTTGNRVTTTDLNRIENGIVNAGGGNPFITFNFSGFASQSYIFNFGIGELDNGEYVAKRILVGGETVTLYDLYVYAPNGEYVYQCPLPAPKEAGVELLFIKPSTSYYNITMSGNISQTTVNFTGFGSTSDAYIITGDCTINITIL